MVWRFIILPNSVLDLILETSANNTMKSKQRGNSGVAGAIIALNLNS